MSRSVPQLQPRLRFPHSGPDAFGPGKADLLRHIAATGSIRTAAAEMGLSYNRAWTLVRDLNTLFHEPLVSVTRGGGTGGGAQLSSTGEEVLARYTRMEESCRDATREDWSALLKLLRSK